MKCQSCGASHGDGVCPYCGCTVTPRWVEYKTGRLKRSWDATFASRHVGVEVWPTANKWGFRLSVAALLIAAPVAVVMGVTDGIETIKDARSTNELATYVLDPDDSTYLDHGSDDVLMWQGRRVLSVPADDFKLTNDAETGDIRLGAHQIYCDETSCLQSDIGVTSRVVTAETRD